MLVTVLALCLRLAAVLARFPLWRALPRGLIPPGTQLPTHRPVISPLRTRSGQAEFRFFYNHVRPHQNLYGSTPAEAWVGIDPFADGFRKEYWFEASFCQMLLMAM
jgi:hypothetical protein